jgi:hypothetical protein
MEVLTLYFNGKSPQHQTGRDQRNIEVSSLKSDEKSNTRVINYLKTIGVYDLI